MWKILKKTERIIGVFVFSLYILFLVFCVIMKFNLLTIESLGFIDWDNSLTKVGGGGVIIFLLARHALFESKKEDQVKKGLPKLPPKEEILKKAKVNAQKFKQKKS